MILDSRRSFVMLAVLVVVGGAALVATMLLRFAGAESAVAVSSAQHARARALAFSGVEAILSELDRERGEILAGRSPRLDRQYVLYETELESGVVRLLSLRSGGELLGAVGGLLDVNLADSEQLVATGLIDMEAAEAIVADRETRDGKRFRVLEDLLEVTRSDGSPAIMPEELLGPLESIKPARDALVLERDRGERALDALGIQGSVKLEDVLTVHSFEPALQKNGLLRINLNVPWSEELGRRMDDRFGEGTGNGLKQIMENVQFDDDGKIVDVLRFFRVEPDDWIDVVDACSSESRWHDGRIDLNTAPVEALQSLPGIDESIARGIVRERDTLSNEERMTRVWPVLRGVIEPEVFSQLAGRVSTRCWLWRIRLAAGTVSVDDPEGPIENPVLLDIVVDLAAPVARIASLRDISGLDVGVRLLEGRILEFDEALDTKRVDLDDGAGESTKESLFPTFDSILDRPSFLEEFHSAFDEEPGASEDGPGGGGTSNGPRGRWSPN